MSHFPCPLAPFEQLMWIDDHADYPMAFPIVGEATGDVDRTSAQAALEAVCERHPLFRARVAELNGRPHWVEPPAGASGTNAIEYREGRTIAQRGFDLRVESGVRVEFWRDADRWRMVWHFHHCCCDGIGAAAAIGEWLLIYDALVHGRDWRAQVAALDNQAFAQRARLRTRRASPPEKVPFWRRVRGVWSHMGQALRVVRTKPAELSATGDAATPGRLGASSELSPKAVLRVRHWDAEQLAALRRGVEACGATLNDFLIAALMMAARDWNTCHSNGRETRPIRVMMPTNQRVGEDRDLSAANVVSYAMLDRAVHTAFIPSELLASVRRETAAIARHNLSRRFLVSLGLAARWPWLMRRTMGRRGSWATAVLSNLGDVSRRTRKSYRLDGDCVVAGGLRLEALYGAPPLRPGTRAGLGVSIFRQRLTVAAIMDPYHFSDADQERFLDQFQEALAELVRV